MPLIDRVDWSRLAASLGGRVEGAEGQHPRLEAGVERTRLVIDLPGGDDWGGGIHIDMRRLRVRMPFAAVAPLTLEIRPSGALERLLGLDDIPTGDTSFDRAYRVTGSDPARIQQLLSTKAGYRETAHHGTAIRKRMLERPGLEVVVAEPLGWPPDVRFGSNTMEMRFETRDLNRTESFLSDLVELFAEVYAGLVALGAAVDEDPRRPSPRK